MPRHALDIHTNPYVCFYVRAGECCGTALETSLAGTFKLTVIKPDADAAAAVRSRAWLLHDRSCLTCSGRMDHLPRHAWEKRKTTWRNGRERRSACFVSQGEGIVVRAPLSKPRAETPTEIITMAIGVKTAPFVLLRFFDDFPHACPEPVLVNHFSSSLLVVYCTTAAKQAPCLSFVPSDDQSSLDAAASTALNEMLDWLADLRPKLARAVRKGAKNRM